MTKDILQLSGPVLWVVVATLVCGAVAFVAFVERGFHIHRARIKTDDFLKGIRNILRGGNPDEAVSICEDTPGPVAHIVKAAILHRGDNPEMLKAAVDDAGLVEIERLESRVGIIATVAQIAPLLGLLGTVFGLMTLLGDLGASQWQSAAVTVGLKRALVATAAGLCVAIPCYAAYNLVTAKIASLVVDMERAASEIMAFLANRK